MPLSTAQTATGAALIAAVLGSGGYAWLKHTPEVTQRSVYAACEKGDLNGEVCCEDMNRVQDFKDTLTQCGPVSPGHPDPFGVRAEEEADWDAKVAAEKAAAK